jgi:hypothetical protein
MGIDQFNTTRNEFGETSQLVPVEDIFDGRGLQRVMYYQAAVIERARRYMYAGLPSVPAFYEPFHEKDLPGAAPLAEDDYNAISGVREANILGLGGQNVAGKSFLYVGLGRSELPHLIRRLGATCHTTEISATTTQQDEYHRIIPNGTIQQPFADETFDHVLLRHVLNASQSPWEVLADCLRVCRTDGRVTITPMVAVRNLDSEPLRSYVNFSRLGLDVFTAHIHRLANINIEEAVAHLKEAGLFIKPDEGFIPARIEGYYLKEYTTPL